MVVGIVGGIGAGKSTVCECLHKLGVLIYDSDQQAKQLMNDSSAIHKALNQTFGKHIVTRGVVDYKALAHIVFSDKQKLQQLNQIVHPKVREHFQEWLQQPVRQGRPVCIESAVLFEAGLDSQVDKVVLIDAPMNERVKRIVRRDKCTQEHAKSRIQSQLSSTELRKKTDLVIDTNENILLLPQIVKLNKLLRHDWVL